MTATRLQFTVAELARAKGLPAKFLAACGLEDGPQGVGVGYWDEAGEPVAVKLRRAATAAGGYGPGSWPKGLPLAPYGLWKLAAARKGGRLVLVEGESDCWALWYHRLPALGLPGAGSYGCLTAEHLAGVTELLVLREPDRGGQQFVVGLQGHLAGLHFAGRVLELRLPAGVKDPADLHLRHAGDPAAFRSAWADAVASARELPLPRTNGHARTLVAGPEWEPPVAVGRLPEAAPFPLEVLPRPLADYVEQSAWATNSPPDFVAVPLLVIAAGCLGARRALAITRSHVQPSTLFAAVIGVPGTGKSPALERVSEAAEACERRNYERWRRELAAWQDEDPEARDARPVPERLLVDDTTMEALMRTLHGNQRGLLMVRDELSALIAGLNQYKDGKGHDRQILLKVWSSASIRVDRKSEAGGLPLVVRRPALSIVGGVQPDVIEGFMSGARPGGARAGAGAGAAVNDGLLDRFLFSYPRDLPAIEEQFREVTPEAEALWARVVQWLLSLEQWRDGEEMRPKVVSLGGEGREAWVEFTRQHAAQLNGEAFPDHLRGPWSKLRGYCVRLALVLHYLRLAVAAPHGGGPGEDVDGDSVAAADKLTAYFKAHYLRVAARMGADPRQDEAGKVLAWLRRAREVERFSRREAYRVLHGSFQGPEALDRPLQLLAQHGYVREVEPHGPGGGRRPTAAYEVNPLWERAGGD